MIFNNIALKYYARAPHISMIITGFLMLKQQGVVHKLDIIDASNEKIESTNNWVVEAIIDSKYKIAYDVCDGYINFKNVNESYACSCDYYFLRSYSKEIAKRCFPNANVLPLGMNYYCTTKNNPLDSPKTVKDFGKKIVKNLLYPFNPQLGRVFCVEEYETQNIYNGSDVPKILFSTRLWNPQGEVGEKKWERMHPERIQINETRIDIIRKARKYYPDIFVGGIYDTEYARKVAPDIILGNSFTNKKNYLQMMKNFDVCIGSAGLHGSIGWKTAEYIVAGKAIILEKPIYDFVGNFDTGNNYLEFETADECLNHIQYLLEHRDKIVEMQKENRDYYTQFLRPDKQILHTLLIAIGKI